MSRLLGHRSRLEKHPLFQLMFPRAQSFSVALRVVSGLRLVGWRVAAFELQGLEVVSDDR